MTAIASLLLLLAGTGDSIRVVLDRVVPGAIERYHVPGAVIAVVRGDSTVLAGYGVRTFETRAPADPTRSAYRLASVAKVFVAATVLEQVDKGLLELDRDVREYATAVPIPPTYPGIITLRHLLTHTAGFDERVIGYGARSLETMMPLGEYLARRLPDRGWPPGLLVGYSNHGMALAAYAAERAAGAPFGELAARTLFQPAGMSRTWYVRPPDSALATDLAPGYRCGSGGCVRAPTVWSHAYPVGLAFSTAADMGRFIHVLLDGGKLEGRQVLAPGTVATMERTQFTHDRRIPGIGFALFEQERRGVRLLTHAGGAPGTATVLALAPDRRLGVFVATNAGEPGFTAEVLGATLDALLPKPPSDSPSATGPVAEYAGSYRLARYAHRTVERFPGVFAFTARARAEGDTLVLAVGSSRRRFIRVDSLLLREVGGESRLALRRDERGRISHLFTGVPTGGAELPGAFERVPWYEGAHFLNEYVSYLLAVPPAGALLWGVIAAVRWARRRRQLRPGPTRSIAGGRGPWLPIAAAVAAQLGFLVFGFGFVARSTRQLGRNEGIVLGMDDASLLLLRLAWPVALAAVPIAVWAILAWRRRWWSGVGRVAYSVLALGALAAAHFLIWFNYLPGRW
jgi:CubicO group peptidase (beta-lactamase class C family)